MGFSNGISEPVRRDPLFSSGIYFCRGCDVRLRGEELRSAMDAEEERSGLYCQECREEEE